MYGHEYAYNEKGNRTQIKRYRRGLKNVSGIYDTMRSATEQRRKVMA